MLLEPVYEQEFMDSSYGFRRPAPRRIRPSKPLVRTVMEMGGGWGARCGPADNTSTRFHTRQLREILDQRIGDGVIRRLIGKWLKAVCGKAGKVTYPEAGHPARRRHLAHAQQHLPAHGAGSLVFEEEIKPQLQGKAALVRFADDFVVVCAERVDAESLLGQIRERFAAYGLTIHPEKTRIVDFRHPWKSERKPQTFDFLGFTHYWGKTRKGGFAVKRKTQGKKFRAALQRVEEWCKKKPSP